MRKKSELATKKKWLGVKSEVRTVDNDQVKIKVFIDEKQNGNWKLVLETKDDGKKYGGNSILNKGYVGIRTDFMDVEFDNYKIREF